MRARPPPACTKTRWNAEFLFLAQLFAVHLWLGSKESGAKERTGCRTQRKRSVALHRHWEVLHSRRKRYHVDRHFRVPLTNHSPSDQNTWQSVAPLTHPPRPSPSADADATDPKVRGVGDLEGPKRPRPAETRRLQAQPRTILNIIVVLLNSIWTQR